ncbi:glycosyltransferase [Tissierella sp.]|uniref:glycosyltransferase family 2 protein n=1 Tax=Tissierella sp. TaxID=41274 RepID=UPI002856BFE5|nr:glycosyltransferase [Tissierella sp.]MDR7855225.1 glycosyltransferase [Tissierella sp.]
MDKLVNYLVLFFGGFILVYMIVTITAYGIMLIIAFIDLRKQYKLDKRELDENYIDVFYTKPLSIIVAAYNEEVGIVDSVLSLLSLRYPQTELIIVNDGSTDQTQQILIERFQMKSISKVVKEQIKTKAIVQIFRSEIHHNLFLIEKENGGKADALNAGINLSRFPYFCSIDGDSILDEKSLLRVMEPIIMSNGEVIAAGGNVRIANGIDVQLGSVYGKKLSNNPLVVMQTIEYIRAFMMGRIALGKFNLILIISGAFSVFSKKWVVEVGGYATDTIGEDMELVVRLHRFLKEKKLKKKIQFVPDPVCWTEAPENLGDLRRQRRRWHQGLIESLWKHKRMTLNPKYGKIGMIAFPYFLFVECFGPIIELGGYIYIVTSFFLGSIYYEFSILLTLLFVLYGSILSAFSILLESWSMNTYTSIKDFVKLILMSLTETFWYRPLSLIWRCEGFVQSILRRKDWGKMKRVGLSKEGGSK